MLKPSESTKAKTLIELEKRFIEDPNIDFRRLLNPIRKPSAITTKTDGDTTNFKESLTGFPPLEKRAEQRRLSDGRVKFGSNSGLMPLGFDVSNLSTRISNFWEKGVAQRGTGEISLPATHLQACSCAACCSGQTIDSGSGFNAGGSKWSQPNGKGSKLRIRQ